MKLKRNHVWIIETINTLHGSWVPSDMEYTLREAKCTMKCLQMNNDDDFRIRKYVAEREKGEEK